MSLCKVAQLFGDDTAVKEYNLSVVLVDSQRDVGVFDTYEAIETTEDVVETLDGVSAGKVDVPDETAFFAMVVVLLPRESDYSRSNRVGGSKKSGNRHWTTVRIVELDVLESESSFGTVGGNFTARRKGLVLVVLGIFAEATAKVGTNIKEIFQCS